MTKITAAGLTDTGCKRAHNEDRIFVDAHRGAFIVADGMGGERCGGVASELAVRAVDEYLSQSQESDEYAWPFGYDSSLTQTQNRVMSVVRFANYRVWEASQIRPECEGMGSTLSVLFVQDDVATIGNIGDSRVYLYRGDLLRQITKDDALVADLVEAGKITKEEARNHPQRNVLTLALGLTDDVPVQLIEFTLHAGDRLLLASDGLHGPVDETEITQIVQTGTDAQQIAEGLVAAAIEHGGPDNVSCILVCCF